MVEEAAERRWVIPASAAARGLLTFDVFLKVSQSHREKKGVNYQFI